MLITIRSLLDNSPYCHEPHKKDDPAFNEYVRYSTWKWLLLDYVNHEKIPEAKNWLRRYVRRNGQEMLLELRQQQRAWERGEPGSRVNKDRFLLSPYKKLHAVMPSYDLTYELLDKMWVTTLADMSLGSGDGSGSGSGSGSPAASSTHSKRTIDVVDLIEDPSGDQKEKKAGQGSTAGTAASHKPPSLPPPPLSKEEQTERTKKRAKVETEIIDLT